MPTSPFTPSAQSSSQLSSRARADLPGGVGAWSSSELLASILDGIADGIAAHDASGQLLFINDAGARTCGYASSNEALDASPDDFLRRVEVFDERGKPMRGDDLPGPQAALGKVVPERLVRLRLRASGGERWISVKATPILDGRGAVRMSISIFRDITREKRSERAARLLADASTVLASSLDLRTTLENVARLVIDHIGDGCAIRVLGSGGEVERTTIVSRDDSHAEAARTMDAHYPALASDSGPSRVVRTVAPLLLTHVTDELLTDMAQDAEHLRLLRALQLHSVMYVPFVARGRVVGVITIASHSPERHFDAQDLALAEELARRAGFAIDNARLYEAEHRAREEAEAERRRAEAALTPKIARREGKSSARKKGKGRS